MEQKSKMKVASRYAQAIQQHNATSLNETKADVQSKKLRSKDGTHTCRNGVNAIKRSAETQQSASHSFNRQENAKANRKKIDGSIKERFKEYQASKQRKRSRFNSDGSIVRQKGESLDDDKSRMKCEGVTTERITAREEDRQKGTNTEATDKLDEIELLTCLYYQLCFVEAKAEETFRTQEKTAMVPCLQMSLCRTKHSPMQTQIFGAWKLLQSKKQSMYELKGRIDHERHILRLEKNIAHQVDGFDRVASEMESITGKLHTTCSALKSALDRVPIANILPPDMHTLRNEVVLLSDTLQNTLNDLEEKRVIDSLTKIQEFEDESKKLLETIGSQLFQIADLLELYNQEVEIRASHSIYGKQYERLRSFRSLPLLLQEYTPK
uniref:AlNc14C156G7654 protein n=1 Tax=Albugo laibachii Nc14 TaxID=890382 RepID=F0WMG4_9STRA|nr:AlNc14C156G7654 [Albugo laibachii Nc14]|eukprot:CCA22496.1 AlNc14C156G7654 [Albugo laibachii Nc14]